MNLYIELIDEKGKVVGQRTIGMESVPGEDYARFSGEVPFTVTQATPVRLTVYESASRIPGYTHISTRLIAFTQSFLGLAFHGANSFGHICPHGLFATRRATDFLLLCDT